MNDNSKSYKTGQIRIDTQAKILEAAEVEFAQFGFKGASMMNIAKRAELPRPNVHYYFKNKTELYNKVLMNILTLWNKAFDDFSADNVPAEALSNYIHAKVMFSKTNPLASKIFANEIIHGAPHLSDYLNNDYRLWIKNKCNVIQSWIDMGKMDAINPYHIIFMIWGSTQYYADFSIQVIATLDEKSLNDEHFDSIANNLIHIILKGCGIK
ncbi:TetR/AcrR family transcriptional regulator [Dasania marina]|uniref:TetR/AcrR family transcriptional regulator n=1 Tax=Dasania marina TaxID=471499 RepID=UPI0030D7859E|tara:strand:- start:26297 stop:26929 length:633 start_codon:yes stop_codon:yes gene_type:complete